MVYIYLIKIIVINYTILISKNIILRLQYIKSWQKQDLQVNQKIKVQRSWDLLKESKMAKTKDTGTTETRDKQTSTQPPKPKESSKGNSN